MAATPGVVDVYSAGGSPIAIVTLNQGAGPLAAVLAQQIVIVDPNASGTIQPASVDTGGNLNVRADKTATCTPATGQSLTANTSAEIIVPNANRMALVLMNYGPGTIYIGLTNAAVQSSNNLWAVPAGVSWTMPVKWLGALYAISDDAATYSIADFSP